MSRCHMFWGNHFSQPSFAGRHYHQDTKYTKNGDNRGDGTTLRSVAVDVPPVPAVLGVLGDLVVKDVLLGSLQD